MTSQTKFSDFVTQETLIKEKWLPKRYSYFLSKFEPHILISVILINKIVYHVSLKL